MNSFVVRLIWLVGLGELLSLTILWWAAFNNEWSLCMDWNRYHEGLAEGVMLNSATIGYLAWGMVWISRQRKG